VTRARVSSRDGGFGSRGFFLSGFGCSGACFGTCTEAEADIASLKDVAIVRQPIEQSCGHFGVAETACPLAEAKISRNDYAGLFVKL
jgi:hypothetical protein